MTATLSQSSPAADRFPHWHGQLDLHYRLDRDRTVLARSRTAAPYRVQRSFYPEATGICHTVALHTAGGIVGGDRLSQRATLDPGSQVLIATPAAAKIYGSRGKSRRSPDGIEARQDVTLTIGRGAYLEWLPRETIVFEGAVYRQDVRVDLEPGATWCGWDIARFGRTARGEGFARGTWRSRTEVWRAGRPLWIDRQVLDLEADGDTWTSYHGLNSMPVIGTLLWIGEAIAPDDRDEIIATARELWREANPGDGSEAGVTTTIDGIACRYRGRSTAKVRHWFTSVWHLLRTRQRGQTAHHPRIW